MTRTRRGAGVAAIIAVAGAACTAEAEPVASPSTSAPTADGAPLTSAPATVAPPVATSPASSSASTLDVGTSPPADGDPMIDSGRWRPELRYTPPFGWMNDPNGLSYVDGLWHLYFQYNPYSVEFGNIGWGHAVSADLSSWQTWPVAIAPDASNLIFSGSIVTDVGAPLCDPGASATCVVAVYTTNRLLPERVVQTQDLAVSTDEGRTFTRFAGNPVLDLAVADFRDPKVFFHEPTGRWVMVVVLPLERQVVLFGSSDLIAWEELSRFGPLGAVDGIWECPDLFALPVVPEDGVSAPTGERWVMKVDINPGHPAGGSGAQWFVGDFDGVTFTPDPDQPLPRWVDLGADFYCATTFHRGGDELGRALWLGWMNNWTYAGELPTFPWRGSMTVARRVWLVDVGDGVALAQEPQLPDGEVVERGAGDVPVPDGGAVLHVRAGEDDEAAAGAEDAGVVSVELLAGDVTVAALAWDVAAGRLELVRTPDGNVGPPTFPGTSAVADQVRGDELRIVVDRNGVEVFDEPGTAVITSLLLPIAPFTSARVTGDGVTVGVDVIDLG
jgi:fructan beta-fructosidase